MPQNKDTYSSLYFPDISGNICVGDCAGKFILLGGKKSLHLVRQQERLHGDDEELKTNHKSFCTAVWKPNHSDAFITASSKIVDLWQEGGGEFQVKSSFNGYSRNVCDIDWCGNNLDLVATSSLNNFSFILDTRDFRRPCANIESVLPISQVRWNKVREHQVATSHGDVINVWDLRNLKKARLSFSLRSDHLSINSFDWCPHSEHHLISSSLNGFVKFWDVSKQSDEVENLFNFGQVVIKDLKYTPLGRGMVAQFMSKGPAELYLWSLRDDLSINQQIPAHLFAHSSNTLQWFFRLQGREPQLVSWSSDQHLKFWDIATYLSKPASCDKSDDPSFKQDTPTSSPRNRRPQTLCQELDLLKQNLPHTIVEKKSTEDREFRVLMEVRGHKVRLNMVMLNAYPQEAPLFSFLYGSNINNKETRTLHESLHQVSRRGECCIEACLKTTLHFLESLQQSTFDRVTEVMGVSRDRLVGENIPFPRTSGARFCGPGFLVCFTRRVWVECNEEVEEPVRRNVSSESNVGTPRAMSALSETAGMHSKVINLARSLPTTSHIPSISQFFEDKELHKESKKEHKAKVRFKAHRTRSPKSYKRSLGPVIVYDLSCLLPIQKSLGENYIFDSNAVEMCRQNALVAQAASRKDLKQVWSLVAQQLQQSAMDGCMVPWPLTPFGRKLVDIWIAHYSKVKDIQTLAMLCCVLMPAKNNKQPPNPAKDFHRKSSIFVTGSTDTQVLKLRRKHSNSLSESGPSHCTEQVRSREAPKVTTQEATHSYKLLSGLTQRQCGNFVHSYCDTLFQWGLMQQRVQLLNSISFTDKNFVKNLAGYKKHKAHCVLCRMPVPGLYVSCFDCGHGGHVRHLSSWFSKHQVCATGCGCRCLTYTNVSMT